MRDYQGSFTVEAAYIVPLILACIGIAVESGIILHNEVKNRAAVIKEEHVEKVIDYMYHKELMEKLLGAGYED